MSSGDQSGEALRHVAAAAHGEPNAEKPRIRLRRAPSIAVTPPIKTMVDSGSATRSTSVVSFSDPPPNTHRSLVAMATNPYKQTATTRDTITALGMVTAGRRTSSPRVAIRPYPV